MYSGIYGTGVYVFSVNGNMNIKVYFYDFSIMLYKPYRSSSLSLFY